jgi:hypothetical protein
MFKLRETVEYAFAGKVLVGVITAIAHNSVRIDDGAEWLPVSRCLRVRSHHTSLQDRFQSVLQHMQADLAIRLEYFCFSPTANQLESVTEHLELYKFTASMTDKHMQEQAIAQWHGV